MWVSEQVEEELDMMERSNPGLNSTGNDPYWECTNCDIKYRPALIPGEEDDHPRCPKCHKKPALADVA